MLEAMMHKDNCFVTLTYAPENLPSELKVEDYQNFMKRFRASLQQEAKDAARKNRLNSVPDWRVRVFGVGEYGSKNDHPHYHAIVFGYAPCERGDTRYRVLTGDNGNRTLSFACCRTCERIHNAWGYGKIHNGTATAKSAQYVAGYINKKMTRKDDRRLNGRAPEFALPSRNPGIGKTAIAQIASQYLDLDRDLLESDVPVTLQHGGRHWPLGRSLRKWFRLYVTGGTNEKAPENAFKLPDVPGADAVAEIMANPNIKLAAKENYLKNFLVDASRQKVANLVAREKIYRKNEKDLSDEKK